jgi:nucleotide-binding universal stress UspA family protein
MTGIRVVGPSTFKNILFVTDFSSSSEMALPHAIALAAAYGGNVYIGHVIAPQLYDLVPPDFVSEVLKQSTAYVQKRMVRLVMGADFGAVPHEVLLEQGELWETLRRMVDQYGIDVIALGTGGRRGLQEVLMGSIAEEILRLAHRPVLTVGPQSREVAPEGEPRCILLANDFSVNCLQAAACADSLARKFRAHLISLHVAPEAPEDPQTITRLEEFFSERLRQYLDMTAFPKGQLEFRVEFGVAGDSILKSAAEHAVDLIVMGVRGAGSVTRATCHLGTNTYQVVSEARCPVLAVAQPS